MIAHSATEDYRDLGSRSVCEGLQAAEPRVRAWWGDPAQVHLRWLRRLPPLRWTEPPPGTQGFALLVADLDDAMSVSVHWVLYGVPVSVRELPEGVPRQGTVAGVGTQGLNDLGGTGYDAPCPPRGPAHRYFFRLYALDSALALPPDQTKGDLLKACSGHLLARVELIGRYKRKESSLNQPPHPCLLAGALREGRQGH